MKEGRTYFGFYLLKRNSNFLPVVRKVWFFYGKKN